MKPVRWLTKLFAGTTAQPKEKKKPPQQTKKQPTFSSREIKAADDRARKGSRALAKKTINNLASLGPSANIALGVGQSFMGGSANSHRINLTKERMLKAVSYRAMMLGDSEGCQTSGPMYDQFGPMSFRPLQETLTYRTTIFGSEDIKAGRYNPRSKGATPLVSACLLFERLSRTHQKVTNTRSTGFDVAVNVSKAEASIIQISSHPAIDRTFDAIGRIKQAASDDGLHVNHGVTFERHGQNGESAGNGQAEYMRNHRRFRQLVNDHAREAVGNDHPAPWIGTQVSGAYGSPARRVSQAQLTMALQDDDYFIAAPDYPFPHLGKVRPPHPRAGDRHPTANAQLMAGAYMGWARFFVQVLHRNWFPTHISDAGFRKDSILVSFRAMKPPLKISEVCVSTTMTMIKALGFDVDDGGSEVPIVGVPEQVGALTFLVRCDRPLIDPYIGLAKGSFGLADIGAAGCGATNIKDSQSLRTLFKIAFEQGHTDMLPGGLLDDISAEDIEELSGVQDMGNWAVAQRKRCKPL